MATIIAALLLSTMSENWQLVHHTTIRALLSARLKEGELNVYRHRRLINKLFGQKMVRCTERFELTVGSASCINKQLIVMVEITAKGNEKISGVTMYAVHSEDPADTRAFGAALGPSMGKSTTFDHPFALTASLFPFDKTGLEKIFIIVAISTPGSDTICYLEKEVAVH
jgi:hypothetical protein